MSKKIKLPEIDSEKKRFLDNLGSEMSARIKHRKKPIKMASLNLRGECPSCGSLKYYDLFGDACKKECAHCGEKYK